MNLSLQSRLQEFAQIIARTRIGDIQNQVVDLELGIQLLHKQLTRLRVEFKNLYILGNGGSAAVASHAVTDFFNVAKIRASTLHESSLLTCMANDFGYEHASARMIGQLLTPGTLLS